MYSYAFVVLYSLLLGGVDFTIPVKVSFLSIILILLGMASQEAWHNRYAEFSQLGFSLLRLAIEVGAAIGLLVLAFYVVPQPLSDVNLTGLDLEFKVLVMIGDFVLMAFGVLVCLDLIDLRRRGKLPQASEGKES
jgi:hypothetical protein